MAMPAKKGDAGLLIALGGPKGPPSARGDDEAAEGEAPVEMGDVKTMAADDAFDAVKSGDRALFGDALDRYVKACMGEA